MAFIKKRTSKGITYYSIVESYREPETQKVKQRVLLNIGNEEALMKFAMKEYSANKSVPSDICFKAYAHGACMALFWLSQLIGIEEMMNRVFSGKTINGMPRSRVLLLAMIHRAVEPGSKRAFESWVSKTSLPYHLTFSPSSLTSQAFWEAMDGISVQQIQDFWFLLIQRLMEMLQVNPRNFHLDYTNFFTFIDTKNCRCYICSLGHNKQKRNDLRQFCLAVITASNLLVPIVWELYEGNCNDKVEFPKFVKRIKASMRRLGIPLEEVTITFDGGSNSEANFSEIGFHFICAHTLTSHKDLYDIDLDEYTPIILEKERERLAYRVDDEVFSGVRGTGVLTYSQALKDGQMKDLEKDIETARITCDEMNKRIQNSRSKIYSELKKAEARCKRDQQDAIEYNKKIEKEWQQKVEAGLRRGRKKKPKPIPTWDENRVLRELVCDAVFTKKYLQEFCWITLVVEPHDRYVIFYVNEEKKEAYCRKYFGKKLTVTDRVEWSTKQILEEYCRQECIENDIFRVSKDPDHFHVRPQYHWTDDKIWVHVFICLAAMSIGELLHAKLESSGIKYSKNRMLDELNNIKDGWIYSGETQVERRMEYLDTDQKLLWDTVLSVCGKKQVD